MNCIPHPWVIEEIERLRRKRAERERPRLELPLPPSLPPTPDEQRTSRSVIVIHLRPVAELAVALVSNAYVTGQTIQVNGGVYFT